jgi:hypothetical protein
MLPYKVSAYRHHNRASVPAELLKSGDEAACLCDQHAGVVVAVLAWVEYRVMGATTDKFEEGIAQLHQLNVVAIGGFAGVGEKKHK